MIFIKPSVVRRGKLIFLSFIATLSLFSFYSPCISGAITPLKAISLTKTKNIEIDRPSFIAKNTFNSKFVSNFRTRNLLLQTSITSFFPTSAQPSTTVVITGSDFIGVTDVSFNGVTATSYTVNSSTQITAKVPFCATTGTISVTTPNGVAVSSNSLTVLPDLTLTSSNQEICSGTIVKLEASSSLNTAGTALNFDGAGQYINVPAFDLNNDGRAITVEFWVNIPSTVTGNRTIFAATSTNSKVFHAMIPANNKKDLAWNYGNVLAAGRLSTDFTPYFNKWTHVALVSAGRLGSFKAIYINGVEVAKDNGLSEGAITSGATSLKIGDDISPTTRTYFRGTLDEFRVWDKVRTPAEIQRDMNAIMPANTPNLLTCWRFDEGSGTSISHAFGNSFQGTLIAGGLTGLPTWQSSGAGLHPHITWSPTAVLSGYTGKAVTATLNSNTTFTATATYPNGCTKNVVQTIKVIQPGTFIGTTNADWHEASNWCGGIPSATTDVVIPANAINMPRISSAAICRNIIIERGAELSLISGANLQIFGTFLPNGTLSHTGGTVAFAGTSGTQEVPALNYHNLTVYGSGTTKVLAGDVTVNGNLIISGSASGTTLDLSSSNLYLRGDIFLEGYLAGSGKLILQNVGGAFKNSIISRAFSPFTNLEIDNTAGVQLLSDIVVNGEINFKNGILYGNGKSLRLNGNISGEDSFQYYSGTLHQSSNISGSNTFNFGGMGVIFDNVGGGNWGNVTITRTTGTAVKNPDDNAKESIKRQWQISPSLDAKSPVELTLFWLTSEDNNKLFESGECKVWKSTNNGQTWNSVGELISLTNHGNYRSVKVTTNSFSTWTISDINSPLPVTWLSFTGKNTKSGILLEWRTATEENSKSFVVERSGDGKTFEPIGEIMAAGNSSNSSYYSFKDSQSLNIPILYYRLQQQDRDAKISYSKITTVSQLKNKTPIEVYPNPFGQEINIRLHSPGFGTAELLDLNNRVCFSTPINANNSKNKLILPTLPSGIYLLRVTLQDQVEYLKLVKE